MQEAFSVHLSKILPGLAPEILNAMGNPQFPSVRYNPRKAVPKFYPGKAIPWEPNAIQLEDNPRFIHEPLWHAGAYYVQESSSMFLGQLVRQWLKQISPDTSLLALDLCAAPGGKSTHLLDVLPENSMLVSNEVIPKRNAILRENLVRWGRSNIIITQNEPADFLPYAGKFDLILVDAPCSGEGLFRREKTAVVEWSTEAVGHCARRQQAILADAINLLKPGGLLIYSTCTFEPAENEEQVKRLLQQGFELIPAEELFPEITEGNIPGTYYFYPHKTSGSGFFIACLRKTKAPNLPIPRAYSPLKKRTVPITASNWEHANNWISSPENFSILQTPYALHAFPKTWSDELLNFSQHLQITYFGCELGELKKDLFLPAHALALSTVIIQNLPVLDIDRENALKYLRKETMTLTETQSNKQGWHLIRHEGLNLGWVKILPGRINNYLPASWRILH